MKVALYGKNSESLEKILLGKGVTVVDRHREDFDLLISYGGDGAMLGAELAYPQRLKMPVRDVETAPHCPLHSVGNQIDAMLAGKLKVTKMMKLVGMTGNVKRYAINDIFIHNMNNVSALRYQVKSTMTFTRVKWSATASGSPRSTEAQPITGVSLTAVSASESELRSATARNC